MKGGGLWSIWYARQKTKYANQLISLLNAGQQLKYLLVLWQWEKVEMMEMLYLWMRTDSRESWREIVKTHQQMSVYIKATWHAQIIPVRTEYIEAYQKKTSGSLLFGERDIWDSEHGAFWCFISSWKNFTGMNWKIYFWYKTDCFVYIVDDHVLLTKALHLECKLLHGRYFFLIAWITFYSCCSLRGIIHSSYKCIFIIYIQIVAVFSENVVNAGFVKCCFLLSLFSYFIGLLPPRLCWDWFFIQGILTCKANLNCRKYAHK